MCGGDILFVRLTYTSNNHDDKLSQGIGALKVHSARLLHVLQYSRASRRNFWLIFFMVEKISLDHAVEVMNSAVSQAVV